MIDKIEKQQNNKRSRKNFSENGTELFFVGSLGVYIKILCLQQREEIEEKGRGRSRSVGAACFFFLTSTRQHLPERQFQQW